MHSEDQCAACIISFSDAPLNRAQEVAKRLVSCAPQSRGHGKPLFEYACFIVETIHLAIESLEAGLL